MLENDVGDLFDFQSYETVCYVYFIKSASTDVPSFGCELEPRWANGCVANAVGE